MKRIRGQWIAPAAACLLTACGGPPYPEGTVQQLFPAGPAPLLQSVRLENRPIHVARLPGTGQPDLLFLHGSPGDWKAWAGYMKDPALAGLGDRLAVDRPGFGGSTGPVIPDLRAQAILLAGLLSPDRRTIVVGHSLGGPLAAWLAIEQPDRVCGAVIVAGALSAAREAPRWYNTIANWSWFQRLLPDAMVASNQEMMPLQQQLRQLEQAWPRLTRRVILIQGDKDMLVDPQTVDDAVRLAPKGLLKVIRVPDQGHFVLWKQPQTVSTAIRSITCQ